MSVEAITAIVAEVPDPELPMLTLADLGILRSVEIVGDRVQVTITPTYSGCPALEAMRAELRIRLQSAGYRDVEVRTALSPAWSTDWITPRGLRRLAEHGIAPPAPRGTGAVTLSLDPPSGSVPCPRCGAGATTELSRFGATACTALRRCTACREPFAHVKAI